MKTFILNIITLFLYAIKSFLSGLLLSINSSQSKNKLLNNGTASNIPRAPAKPPPTKMENIMKSGDAPTVLPSIFGPKYQPSNCCKANINNATHNA